MKKELLSGFAVYYDASGRNNAIMEGNTASDFVSLQVK